MSSSIDQLLLSASQQAEIDRAKKAWLEAEAAGDTAGMDRGPSMGGIDPFPGRLFRRRRWRPLHPAENSRRPRRL